MRQILILVLLFSGALAHADVEILYNDGSVGIVSDGRVLFGDQQTSILYVEGQEHFTVIEWNERTYMNVTPGFAEDLMAEVNAQMEQMLDNVPPAQREMFEKQMKGRMPQLQTPRTTSVRKTGESANVAGIDCDEAEIVFDDDSVQSVVCIASPDDLGISDADFDAMTAAMKAMAEMAATATNITMEDDYRSIGGLPIRTTMTAFGQDNELESIKTSGVDVSRLQIPEDFREVSIEDMMQR